MEWLKDQLKLQNLLVDAKHPYIWELNIDGSCVLDFAMTNRGLFFVQTPKQRNAKSLHPDFPEEAGLIHFYPQLNSRQLINWKFLSESEYQE